MSEDKGEICDNSERRSQVFAITRICGYPSLQTKLCADCMKCGYSVTGPREILHAIPCGLNSEEIVGLVNNRLIRINQKFNRPSLMKLKRIGPRNADARRSLPDEIAQPSVGNSVRKETLSETDSPRQGALYLQFDR
jgi:hypothetical protein